VVARSSSVAAFAPVDQPRITVAADGTLAAIQEPSRISVVEISSCAAFAELGTDPAALGCDVAWVGTPPRLLVLSRFESHSTAHLVDPMGPRTIAEIRLDAAMRLFAAVGTHALVVGGKGAAILAASDRQLTPYQFPARTVPAAAGAASAQFVVALPGAIEEWDPVSRLPKRRLKLPRLVNITAVGGSDRVVWMTTTQEPARVDVIPLVNRGQPKGHDLPEPIAAVAAHPRSDLIACLGATSGRVWVVDLDGRSGVRLVGPAGIERVEAVGIVLGRVAGVIAAQAERPIAVVELTTETSDAAPRPKIQTSPLEEAKRSALYDDESPPTTVSPASPLAVPGPLRAPTVEPFRTLWSDASATWREAIAEWAREPTGAPPAGTPVEVIAQRFDVPAELERVVAFVYGQHLLGADGAAPLEVARLSAWSEALGRGELVARGIATFQASRVRLSEAVVRALDDHPPRTGTLVGTPGPVTLLGPCAIVAGGPVAIIAEACLPSIGGAILAAEATADPADLIAEARAYGAAPLWRVDRARLGTTPEHPIILVVDDDASADELAVPRLR
jgi:hypothetical protein